jgi:hypothetical protein
VLEKGMERVQDSGTVRNELAKKILASSTRRH